MGVTYDVVYQSFNNTIWLVIAEKWWDNCVSELIHQRNISKSKERENATNCMREGRGDSYILVYAGTVPIISPKYKISFIS